MSKAKDVKGVNPSLDKFITDLLNDAMKPKKDAVPMSLTDKMKIVDRALKLEALKQKMTDDGFGGGFHDEDE